MPGVLTTESQVLCGPAAPSAHGGTVSLSSTAKLTVKGHPVLLESNIAGQAITGCATTLASDASGPVAQPCLKVSKVPQLSPPPPVEPPPLTSGKAIKLTVNGKQVMLDTVQGFTNGMVSKTTPLNKLTGKAVQTKLTAI
jgi:hypothetical protein